MRALIVGTFFTALLSGCQGAKPGSVDPCTGRDMVRVGIANPSDSQAMLRQSYWQQNPALSKDEACKVGQLYAVNSQLKHEEYLASATDGAATSKQAQAGRASLTDAEINRLVTFSTMVGRALACGENVDSQRNNIGEWLNGKISDPAARGAYTEVAIEAVSKAAMQQRSGLTPDTCEAVQRGFRGARLK